MRNIRHADPPGCPGGRAAGAGEPPAPGRRRPRGEPDIATLARLWREGRLSAEELSEHLERRQLPLFPFPEHGHLPPLTRAGQRQLALFMAAETGEDTGRG